MFDKKPLIILTGPTAVGKTDLSIELAKAVNGCIISADSMQVYTGMDIGTAKIHQSQMQGVKHYLIDVLDPSESFDVTLFQKMSKEALSEIYSNAKIPIIAGGTGFYIQALLYDIDFKENEKDTSYREYLYELADKQGAQALHKMLCEVDYESAQTIHSNNVKRVVRALEFFHQTGMKISEHNEEQRQKESPYNYAYFVLSDDRQLLYERINRRVDSMMDGGLIDEVKSLKEKGYGRGNVSMQGIGYKETLDYLDGNCSLQELADLIKKNTRHFAKRQLTWFKRESDVIWLDYSKFSDKFEMLKNMLEILENKGII